MKIHAGAIAPYLDDSITVKVHLQGGAYWRALGFTALHALIAEAAIHGTGSQSKLRYVTLDVTIDQAEAILEQAKRASTVRGRLQNSQASVTCITQLIASKRGCARVYRHVRTEAFSPMSRLVYA